MPPGENNWNEWKKFILKELERLNSNYEGLNRKIEKLLIDTSTLKVKAGVWGFLAGLIPVVITLAGYILILGRG